MRRRSWLVAAMWGVALVAITIGVDRGETNCATPQSNGSSLDPRHWTHFVRIGGFGLGLEGVDANVRGAVSSHVVGIETDPDIPGGYERFLDPGDKLRALQTV